MNYLFFLIIALGLGACSSLDNKKLEGRWEHPDLGFEFTEGQHFKMRMGQAETSGTYNSTFNSLELVGEDNKVLFNINIKEIKGDTLVLDLPSLGTSRIYNLIKTK